MKTSADLPSGSRDGARDGLVESERRPNLPCGRAAPRGRAAPVGRSNRVVGELVELEALSALPVVGGGVATGNELMSSLLSFFCRLARCGMSRIRLELAYLLVAEIDLASGSPPRRAPIQRTRAEQLARHSSLSIFSRIDAPASNSIFRLLERFGTICSARTIICAALSQSPRF